MKIKNRFTLFGRICWKGELKETIKGRKLILINIGIKIAEDTYKNFFVTFFNDNKTDCANIVNDSLQVNDFAEISGYLSSYKKTDEENKTLTQLVGKSCIKCKYNPDIKSWEEDLPLFNDLQKAEEVASL